MKKSLVNFLPLFIIPFIFSCKSTQVVNLENHCPIAIMTIYSNPGLPWYEDSIDTKYKISKEDNGILTGFINRALDRNNIEIETAQERIDMAANIFIESLRNADLELIDPNNFQDSPAYKNAGKNFMDTLGNTLPAKGFDAIVSSSKKLNKEMAEATQAKSLIYIKFNFKKEKELKGFHEVGVKARVSMKVYAVNSEGKKLLNKEYIVNSPEIIEFSKNHYDKEKLCNSFRETIQIAVNKFLIDFKHQSDFSDLNGEDGEEIEIPINFTKDKTESDTIEIN